MTKLKIIELILTAIGLLLTAAKAIIKFIGLLGKMKPAPTPSEG